VANTEVTSLCTKTQQQVIVISILIKTLCNYIDAYIESARAPNQVWTNNRELLICLLQQLWPVRVWRRQPYIKQLPWDHGLTSSSKGCGVH